MHREDRRKTKGHGCLGFGIALAIVLIAIAVILFFTTNIFDGLKRQIYSAFYPQKYAEQVEQYSSEFGVDEDLVYAVIKTESGFREDVESYAGAVGLMQLMPETFEWLQDELDGEIRYTAEDLKNPSVNIRYGTYFLSYLLEYYGDEATACAAYNAGMSNVEEWLGDSRYSADGRTLTAIPYHETQDYVKKVQETKAKYKEIYGR